MPRLSSAPVNPQQDRGGQEEDQVQVERVVDPKPYHLFERRPALGNLTKRGKQIMDGDALEDVVMVWMRRAAIWLTGEDPIQPSLDNMELEMDRGHGPSRP